MVIVGLLIGVIVFAKKLKQIERSDKIEQREKQYQQARTNETPRKPVEGGNNNGFNDSRMMTEGTEVKKNDLDVQMNTAMNEGPKTGLKKLPTLNRKVSLTYK